MTVYGRNDLVAVSVSEAHGGCNQTHRRPVEHGAPAKLWALTCENGCEDYLRNDPHWSSTISELPETHDEKLRREDFEKRGALDERKLMAMALAKLTGISIPDTIAGAITGMLPHIAGELECPACGQAQAPGKPFCADCGSPMSGPAAKALDAPERPAEPAPASSSSQAGPAPQRLRDARLDTLQTLARTHSLSEDGTRPDLISRLAAAGVTNADLRRFLDGTPVAA